MATPRVIANVTEVHINTDIVVIQVSEDRLRLRLKDQLERLAHRHVWLAPAGIFLTVLTVFVSANFKEAWGMKPDTWHAIFVILGVLSAAATIASLIKRGKAPTIDDLVERLKKE